MAKPLINFYYPPHHHLRNLFFLLSNAGLSSSRGSHGEVPFFLVPCLKGCFEMRRALNNQHNQPNALLVSRMGKRD